jgi:hypothetical protein
MCLTDLVGPRGYEWVKGNVDGKTSESIPHSPARRGEYRGNLMRLVNEFLSKYHPIVIFQKNLSLLRALGLLKLGCPFLLWPAVRILRH